MSNQYQPGSRAATEADIGGAIFVRDSESVEWQGPYELGDVWEGSPYPYWARGAPESLPFFAYAVVAEHVPEGYLRGHGIWWDEGTLEWRYCDTDEAAEGHVRPCARCARPPTENDHDPCLPSLPGVTNACCGHGRPESAYIQFQDGRIVRGFDTVEQPVEEQE